MVNRYKYCLYGFLAFVFSSLGAQENYRVMHWEVEQGLSFSNCHALIKDSIGFLWIATPVGLNRFDGNSFKVYLPAKNKSGQIAGTRIDGLVEDSLHNIWAGTDRGVSCYQLLADSFKSFYPQANTFGTNTFIIPFAATKDEVFCLEPEFSITAYNIYSYTKRIVTGNFHADVGNDFVRPSYSILDEKTNCVWIPDGTGLLQVSLTTGKKVHYNLPVDKVNRHTPELQAMCQDILRHCIWITTSEGLFQLDLNNNTFIYRDIFKGEKNITSRYTNTGISIDTKGEIWLCTNQQGIIIFNPEKETIKQPVFDSTLRSSISYANFCIYCDKNGVTWHGENYNKGLYQLIPFSKASISYTHDNMPEVVSSKRAFCIQNGTNNDLWIGTNDGLNIFNIFKKSFNFLGGKDLPGFRHGDIYELITDTLTHKAWLGVNSKQVLEMNMDTKECRPVIFKDSTGKIIQDYSISYLTKAAAGCIVRVLNHGIYKVVKDSATATQIISLPHLKITGLYPLGDSIIFLRLFGSAGSITYVNKNDKWIRTKSAIDSIPWTSITYNKIDRTFWLGSTAQLFHVNAAFDIVSAYGEKDGLSYSGIQSSILDNNNNLWFNTNSSIGMLNGSTGKIITLSDKDGWQMQKYGWLTPNCRDVNGDLYFAGMTGVTCIQPQNFHPSFPGVSTYIQSLEINQHSYAKATDIRSKRVINLQHFENNISVQTGMIDYYSQGKGNNRIRYMLKGIESSWQYAPCNYIIRYVGLPAGSYTLYLQASNAAGEWNGPQAAVAINIKPAFWNTWWFTLLVIAAIIALIYWFMKFKWTHELRLQKERAEKERILAEMRFKTAELEMQALRAQMNPHFIFNSLNAINHFILKNESETAANYLIKFSRLIRMVLNNSKSSFIPLEAELETLQLYVDLEKLRFKNSFDYISTCSNSIDVSNICIPPLILQPFVENAIWHGLMHKESKGQLNINIALENELLCCTISDNGIGRSSASKVKNLNGEKITSMGLSITKSRIDLINDQVETNNHFEILDLVDDAGKSQGTKVVLKIKCKNLEEVDA